MVRCQTVMNAATATRGTQRGAGSEGQAADERWRILSLMLCTHFSRKSGTSEEGVNTGGSVNTGTDAQSLLRSVQRNDLGPAARALVSEAAGARAF